MLTRQEYNAQVERFQSKLQAAADEKLANFDGEPDNDDWVDLFQSIGFSTEFETMVGDFAELITVETNVYDRAAWNIEQVRDGKESGRELLEWWIDVGPRLHVLEMEEKDALYRNEIKADDLPDADTDTDSFIDCLEALLVREDEQG